MKISLIFTIVMLMVAVTVHGDTCPNGMNCNGECCKIAPIGNDYWCCKGILHCQQSQVGVGYCSPIKIPLPFFGMAKKNSSDHKAKHLGSASSEIPENVKDSAEDLENETSEDLPTTVSEKNTTEESFDSGEYQQDYGSDED